MTPIFMISPAQLLAVADHHWFNIGVCTVVGKKLVPLLHWE